MKQLPFWLALAGRYALCKIKLLALRLLQYASLFDLMQHLLEHISKGTYLSGKSSPKRFICVLSVTVCSFTENAVIQ